jgi:hypothetical protein
VVVTPSVMHPPCLTFGVHYRDRQGKFRPFSVPLPSDAFEPFDCIKVLVLA